METTKKKSDTQLRRQGSQAECVPSTAVPVSTDQGITQEDLDYLENFLKGNLSDRRNAVVYPLVDVCQRGPSADKTFTYKNK